jgi:predicted nucleic acid-binding protein
MRSAVDTNVFSALWTGGPDSLTAEKLLGDAIARGSLIICSVAYAELLAHPSRSQAFIDSFLRDTGIDVDLSFGQAALIDAGRAYRAYRERRRRSGGGGSQRIVADFLIGAHAADRADRLLTFNPGDFKLGFPRLILAP